MANDTISKKAAIDAAIEAADEWDGGCNPERDRAIRTAIMALPAVDAVSIVRCRECVYGELAYCDLDGEEWVCCRNLGGGKMGKGDGFDFCSHGERREE